MEQSFQPQPSQRRLQKPACGQVTGCFCAPDKPDLMRSTGREVPGWDLPSPLCCCWSACLLLDITCILIQLKLETACVHNRQPPPNPPHGPQKLTYAQCCQERSSQTHQEALHHPPEPCPRGKGPQSPAGFMVPASPESCLRAHSVVELYIIYSTA